jgi:hypothetical protein
MTHIVFARKSSLTETRIVDAPDAPLADGGVRLAIESFSVTANNVTYAVIGDMFGYWNFFPTGKEDWGVVPMWGHARVAESQHPDIAVGERVYGYLPMATHLDVLPSKVSDGGFTDMADHRQPMSPFYNQYSRLAADPEHDPAREDARMIFGPLFKTGFLIEAFMRRNDWFGASQCVLTSASSKTAMALAHCIRQSSPGVKRIGLTSPGNIAFVEKTGLYDVVLPYGDDLGLPQADSVSVDFAGNAGVLRAVHVGLGEQLHYSCTVGMTHVGARGGTGDALPGPAPTLFFAPDHAVAIVKDMGPQAFGAAVAQSWTGFLTLSDSLLHVDHRDGLAAAVTAFADTLAGKADPAVGIVIRP